MRAVVGMIGLVGVMVAAAGDARAGDPSLAELTKELVGAAPKDRPRVVGRIGYLRDPARLDILEKLVGDADPAVRLAALQGLSPQYRDVGKGPRWKAVRRRMIADPDPKVRYEAGGQLRPLDPDDVAPLLARLAVEKDPLPTQVFVLELHDVNAPGLVDLLIPMIGDPARQQLAISTLGFTQGDPRVVPVLLDALQRKAPFAVDALGNTGDPKALHAVLEVLRTTKDPDYLHEAITVQLTYPDGRAVPRLLELWAAMTPADKAIARGVVDDPSMIDAFPMLVTRALAAIGEIDPAPCDAMKAAKAELRAYLKTVLPTGCQTEIRHALTALIEAEVEGKDRLQTQDARFAVSGDHDAPWVPTDQVADALTVTPGFSNLAIVHASFVIARDGKAAVVAAVVKSKAGGKAAEVRLSALAIPTSKGWAIAGGLWSLGRANAAVNDAAASGKLALGPLPSGHADPVLVEEVKKFVDGQVDTLTASRTDFVAIGSAPGELIKSGAVLYTGWKAAWLGKTTIDGPVTTIIAPNDATGVAVATLMLTKTRGSASYKVPFRVLFGFDKFDGRWSLVHVHFASPAP